MTEGCLNAALVTQSELCRLVPRGGLVKQITQTQSIRGQPRSKTHFLFPQLFGHVGNKMTYNSAEQGGFNQGARVRLAASRIR